MWVKNVVGTSSALKLQRKPCLGQYIKDSCFEFNGYKELHLCTHNTIKRKITKERRQQGYSK